jgi:hypothetical protein
MIKVEFTGYVNEILPFDWGTILKVSHQQQKQNDQGQWETVGYDRFDVVLQKDDIAPAQGSIVTVTGRMKSKEFDRRDGSKGMALEVRADSVTLFKRKPAADADLPF